MWTSPKFWYQKKKGMAYLLSPFGYLYYKASEAKRKRICPYNPPVPVLCVGNLTLGGAGKTPTALAVANLLIQDKHTPHFLSRGYGGKAQKVPLLVDPRRHTAADVGDEALLLSRMAPTWVCPDRVASLQAAVEDGASAVIMDDGFQNPSVAKDVNLLVVDGLSGFGNGCVFPAGPLREPIQEGLDRADAVIILGKDIAGVENRCKAQLPCYHAAVKAADSETKWQGQDVIAFAGIGYPEKFFHTLETLGANVVQQHPFPDHHVFTPAQLDRLKTAAKHANAKLVTTEKDLVRIPPEHRDFITPLKVSLEWQKPNALKDLILPRMKFKKSANQL